MVGNSPIRAVDEPVWHIRATRLPVTGGDETGRQWNVAWFGGGVIGVVQPFVWLLARRLSVHIQFTDRCLLA
jgi:hypothetical protein